MYTFKSSIAGQNYLRTPACSVCYESFDDKKHLPKILQCAHTVCETCISLLEDQNRQNNNRAGIDRTYVSVRCPTCRTLTQVPRSCVRSNYQLLDVIETMRNELSHNISFLSCTGCRGIYHEKDVNICVSCSPITTALMAEEVLQREIQIGKFALCSTCILNMHISAGHLHIALQPLRVEMQKVENLRRINSARENLLNTQKTLREKLDRVTDKWFESDVSSDMSRFQMASNSFDQKQAFDEFVLQLNDKAKHVEKLVERVEKWSEDLEQSTTPVPVNPARPTRPPTPGAAPLAPENQEQIVPANNYIYYFEHNIWDPQ